MNVLITGGTGFIGRQLVKALLSRGDKVTVLTRDKVRASRKLEKEVECIENLDAIHQSPEVIVNLAGAPIDGRRWTEKYKKTLIQSRLTVTQKILDYVKHVHTPHKVLISGSAIGYYGLHADMPLTEDSKPSLCFTHDLCRMWEQHALEAEKLGLRVCLLRTGIVLGKGGALSKMLPAFKLGLGGPMGSGQQWFSWVHIEDLVSMILFLIDNETCMGPFNATAKNPVVNEEFSRALASVLHRPAFFRMPSSVLRVVFGQLAEELLLHGQRVVPAKFEQAGFEGKYPELKGALESILVD